MKNRGKFKNVVKKRILIFLYFSFLTINYSLVFAQQHKVDSLLVVLNNTKEDTARLRIYFAICDACDLKDNLKYGDIVVALTDKLLSQTKDEKERKVLLKQRLKGFEYIGVYYQDSLNEESKVFQIDLKKFEVYRELKDTNLLKSAVATANYLRNMGNYPRAIEYCQKGIELSQEINYKKGWSWFLFIFGCMCQDKGEYKAALDKLKQCLSIDTVMKFKDKEAWFDICKDYIIRDYSRIALIYFITHDTSNALKYCNKVIFLSRKEDDIYDEYRLYWDMAGGYEINKDLSKALTYYNKALNIVNDSEDHDISKTYAGLLLNDIGQVYSEEDVIALANKEYKKSDSLFTKALQYQIQALEFFEKIDNKGSVRIAILSLAETNWNHRDYKQAKKYVDQYLGYKDLPQRKMEAERLASRVDSALGDYKEAYLHNLNYIILCDKLNGEAVQKAATQEKYQNEYDKQKAEDKAEQAKKDAVAEADKKKQRIISSSIASGLILALIFAGFVFRSLRITRKQKQVIEVKSKETEEQKKVIEEKNKDILDSITYAKRLQDAILPPLSVIEKHLPESFVLYKPKDIVAGDFYWMEKVDNTILIAACDCTGHGVPGAMVSVVCSNALNRALNEFKITETGKLLDKTRELVLQTYGKSEGEVNDGMDCSFCSINTKTKQITWSGAYNPLWYIPSPKGEGQGEVIEITGDKQPIGKTDNPKPFTTHTINLPPNGETRGGLLYLFTDGYADQFGGPKGKKFKYKQLQQLLVDNSKLSMTEQKGILEKTLESWKGGLEQVDDILIIGIRV